MLILSHSNKDISQDNPLSDESYSLKQMDVWRHDTTKCIFDFIIIVQHVFRDKWERKKSLWHLILKTLKLV